MDDKGGGDMAKQAIEGTRLNAFGLDPDELVIVGLDDGEGPEHPLYDERVALPLDEALVRNIMVFGVIEPIVVRKNGTFVEVVDGRQRVRAAREANSRLREQGAEPLHVPAVVKRGDNGQIMGVMLSTFLRQDDTPIGKAQKAARYLDTGKSEAEAAIVYGVSTQTIRNWMALLELAPRVQAAVTAGQIGAAAALELRDLPHREQESKIEAIAANGAAASAGEMRRQRKARAAKPEAEGDNAERAKVVSRIVLRKLAEHEKFDALPDEARALLLWILGETGQARRVKGLSGILRAIGAAPNSGSTSDAE